MSRYRYWWRPNIVHALRCYMDLQDQRDQLAPEELRTMEAIEGALRDTEALHNGAEIRSAVRFILMGRCSVSEYASSVYYSRTVVQRWLSQFLLLVADRLGYLREADK